MIGWRELLILLVIVLLIFGTKRLRGAGRDLGEAVKGFKKGMGDDDKPSAELGDDSRRDERRDDETSRRREDDTIQR